MTWPAGSKVVHVRDATKCRTCGVPIKKGWVALAWTVKPTDDPKDWSHEHDCKQCTMARYR